MPHKKTQFKVQQFKDWVNSQLKRTDYEATDEFKKGLCTGLEYLLNACHWDIEYSYNYWDEKGYTDWQQSGGSSGQGDEKEKFLLGPSGQEYNRNYR